MSSGEDKKKLQPNVVTKHQGPEVPRAFRLYCEICYCKLVVTEFENSFGRRNALCTLCLIELTEVASIRSYAERKLKKASLLTSEEK